MELKEKLGGNIRQARVRLGVTQVELSKELNVSRSTLYLWETGKFSPSLENLIKIADILGIKFEDLTALNKTLTN